MYVGRLMGCCISIRDRLVVLLKQYLTQSIFLLHMKALLNNIDGGKSGLPKWEWQKTPPQGDIMHQIWTRAHPDVTARRKIDFSSVFSALLLFSLSTLAHWVKCWTPPVIFQCIWPTKIIVTSCYAQPRICEELQGSVKTKDILGWHLFYPSTCILSTQVYNCSVVFSFLFFSVFKTNIV